MKSSLRISIILIIVFATIILLAEMLANIYAYYGLNTTRSEYIDRIRADQNLNTLTWLLRYKPHPYFGYESDAIQDFERKRLGNTDKFVIGILGGSVAKSFGDYIKINSKYLDSMRSFIPGIDTKEIAIENLALGAGKQPQQFFISTYFADSLDMIINIDGFNDASPDHFLPVYPLDFPITSLKYLERSNSGQAYAKMASVVRWIYILIHDLPVLHLPILGSSSLPIQLRHVREMFFLR